MPSKKNKQNSEILTIMVVDLSNYTEMSSKMNREEFSKMHDTFDSICLSTIEDFGGNPIKKMGDAFLVTFRSPTNALNCGAELQKIFKNFNEEEKPKNKLKIKVAIHSGEVLLRRDDVFGEAVNLASRISANMPANEIYFTKSVYLAVSGIDLSLSPVGLRKYKGINKKIHISKVNWETGKKSHSFPKISIKSRILEYLFIFLGIILTSLILNLLLS